ncbi:MAG: hypothetical protein LBJ18_01890 [Rickettsiales bacterium]|jgi:hypothetical protein|nr:hypothetical protein [Rickettsiales bacterium]
MRKYGKIIIPYGVFPEKYEMETANFFAGLGKDVEFVEPSSIKGLKSPDIQMDGVIWEIKSPCGKSKQTIEKLYKKASAQSENIIFDLRHTRIDEYIVILKIKREFSMRKNKVRRLIIITKSLNVLDLSK